MNLREATNYVIDSDDRLIEVNGAFWEFGKDNGLVADEQSIIGRSLWHFLENEGISYVYRHILKIVRTHKKPLCFPMRCDSRDTQRHMTMTIAPRNDGSVRFIVELDKEIRLHAAAEPSAGARRRTLCRSCQKLEHDDDWIPLEDALSAQLFDIGADTILLDICDECETRKRLEVPSSPYVN